MGTKTVQPVGHIAVMTEHAQVLLYRISQQPSNVLATEPQLHLGMLGSTIFVIEAKKFKHVLAATLACTTIFQQGIGTTDARTNIDVFPNSGNIFLVPSFVLLYDFIQMILSPSSTNSSKSFWITFPPVV